MSTGVLSLELKGPGREAYHSSPSSAEVKNDKAYLQVYCFFFAHFCNLQCYLCYKQVRLSVMSKIKPYIVLNASTLRRSGLGYREQL
jgi:hypothetical protein